MDTQSQLNIIVKELGANNLGETVGEVEKSTHGEEASFWKVYSDIGAFAIREILLYHRIMVWLQWHLEKAFMQFTNQENGTRMTI